MWHMKALADWSKYETIVAIPPHSKIFIACNKITVTSDNVSVVCAQLKAEIKLADNLMPTQGSN